MENIIASYAKNVPLHHNFLYPFFKKSFGSILSTNDVAGLTQKINRKQIQLVSAKVQTFGLYNERDHSFGGISGWSHTRSSDL